MKASPARTITIAVLIGCVVYAVAGAFSVDRWTVVIVAMLAVIEGDASWRYREEASLTPQRKAQLRFAEIGLLVIAAKVIELALSGWNGVRDAIDSGPLGIATLTYLLAVLGGVAAWAATQAILDVLSRIGEPGGPVAIGSRAFRSLIKAFLWGGLVITVITALAVAEEARAPTSRILWPALVYFTVGLVALGMTRQREATVRWEASGADVPVELTRRWNSTVLLVVVVLVVPALIIPAGDSTLLLEAIVWIVVGIAYAAAFIVRPFLLPAVRLINDLESRFLEGREVGADRPRGTGGPLFDGELVGDALVALLWLAMLFALVSIVVVIARQRGTILELLRGHRPARGLVALPSQFFGAIVRSIRRALVALGRWIRRVGPRSVERPPVVVDSTAVASGGVVTRAPWTDDPRRHRIAEIYGRLEDDRIAGRGRAPHETPQEYLRRLPERIPTDAAGALTADYEEARFSNHSIEDGQVSNAVQSWEMVEGALQPEE